MISYRLCISIILFFCLCTGAFADEHEERNFVVLQGYSLLQARNFGELERLSREYDVSESTTSGGALKSNLLDDGVLKALRISKEDDIRRVRKLSEEWLRQFPKSPYAHNAFAGSLLDEAHFYRGGDWSRNTKPERIRKFNDGVKLFDKFLDETKSIWGHDIRWCIKKIDALTYLSENMSEARRLITSCQAKFDNPSRIWQKGLKFYSPKWSGSSMALDEFIRSSMRFVEKKKGREEGVITYASLYAYFADFHGGYYFSRRLFLETKADWGLMSEGLGLEVKKYPGAWKLNKYASLACIAGDRAVFDRIIADASFYVIADFWKYISIDQCMIALKQ